jgi:hypothetical protein
MEPAKGYFPHIACETRRRHTHATSIQEDGMSDRTLSNEDVLLLKRALYGRCSHLGISPEGSAAQFEATQLIELFRSGIRDEQVLATRPIHMAAEQRKH